MSWLSIENAIQAWVVAASGLADDHVIWAEQSQARPTTPYIALNIIGIHKEGRDWVDKENISLSVSDVVETVDFANNELDLTAHGLNDGDGPLQLTTTGTLPTGLSLLTDYYIIKAGDDAIQLATSLVNAMAPTPVTFSDVGAGTHTLTSTSDSETAGAEINHTVRGPRILQLSIQCFGADAIGAASPIAILDNVLAGHSLPDIHNDLVTAGVGVGTFQDIQSIGGVLGSEFESRAATTGVIFIAHETTQTGTYIETVEDPERI